MACNSGQDDYIGGGAPQWPLSQTPVVVLPVCKIIGDDRGSFSGQGYLKRGAHRLCGTGSQPQGEGM